MSDLMGRENHVFTVVTEAEMETDLDWRLPVFEAERYLIAFDVVVAFGALAGARKPQGACERRDL